MNVVSRHKVLVVLAAGGTTVLALAAITATATSWRGEGSRVPDASPFNQTLAGNEQRASLRAASSPILHDDFGALTVAAKDLAELSASSTMVVRVRTISRAEDYWPDVNPQILVYSRFVLEIQEVIQGGAVPGERLTVYLPGGTKAEWGNPQPGGSFRPKPGERTIESEDGGYPRFDPRREEIVFVQRTSIQGAPGVLWIPPEGRYQLRGNRLISIFVDVPGDPASIVDKDAKADVVGKTIDELRSALLALNSKP